MALGPIKGTLGFTWEQAIRFVRNLRAEFQPRNRDQYKPPPGARVKADDYVQFVPTPMRVVRRMLSLAEVRPNEKLYDLGCGDGRIVITAAREFGARAVGFDIDPARLQEARQRAQPETGKIAFRRQNLLKVDLRPASVVTLYLLPSLNQRLMRQLRKLKPGSRVVTHAFQLPGISPCKSACIKTRTGRLHEIFVYRVPFQRL